MHYKNKIYDITAVEMFKRLEAFLTRVGVPDCKQSLDKKIKEFEKLPRFAGHTAKVKAATGLMRQINNKRNDIVHPPNMAFWMDFSIEPIVVLKKRENFNDFRGKCLRLEGLLNQPPFNMYAGFNEVMIPTLKYGMGNLGDIVKHGLLAEFAEWHESPLKVTDTFAGCPWGGNYHINERMKYLEAASNGEAALMRAYSKKQGAKYRLYFGSSHLIRRIGENCDKKITVLASDRDEDARANLKASGLDMIELPNDNNNDNDGFAILDNAVFDEHRPNLILLDPYGRFLRDEYHSNGEKLREIAQLTETNPSLWVALFVLDMHPEGDDKESRQTVRETHNRYNKLRNSLFRDKAVYLYCPKAKKPNIDGESEYNVAVLLISEQLKNKDDPKIRDLQNRLRAFSQTATAAFKKEKGLTLTGDKEVKYCEV
ncbi:MAG: hypothetical protein ACR2P4_05875 [Gammaproteobacteria bacterium]